MIGITDFQYPHLACFTDCQPNPPTPFPFVFLDLILTEASIFFSKTYTALEWNSPKTKADNSSANTKYTISTTSTSTKLPMLWGGKKHKKTLKVDVALP